MSETGDVIGTKSISIEKLTKADLPRTVIQLAWPVVLDINVRGILLWWRFSRGGWKNNQDMTFQNFK